eukprot:2811672-Rhodomonas_salina.1
MRGHSTSSTCCSSMIPPQSPGPRCTVCDADPTPGLVHGYPGTGSPPGTFPDIEDPGPGAPASV